jgi:hypothetical protein
VPLDQFLLLCFFLALASPTFAQLHAQTSNSGGSVDVGDIFRVYLERILMNGLTLALNYITNELLFSSIYALIMLL